MFKHLIYSKKKLHSFILISFLASLLLCFIKACNSRVKKSNNNQIASNGNATPKIFAKPILNTKSHPNYKKLSLVNQLIETNTVWLANLGINPGTKCVIVNAQNRNITFGGGGINGAITGFVQAQGQTQWLNLRKPDGTSFPDPQNVNIPEGDFCISDSNFGYIFQAVGPSGNTNWTQADLNAKLVKLLSSLVFNMLNKAVELKVQKFVLCALSTVIFACAGKDYTEEDFIKSAYRGLIEGIDRFIKTPKGDQLDILLNNWDEEYFDCVS